VIAQITTRKSTVDLRVVICDRYSSAAKCLSCGRTVTRDIRGKGFYGIIYGMNERIEINPMVCHGSPVIRGTRVLVSQILGALSGGDSVNDVLEDYPSITAEDVSAVTSSNSLWDCRGGVASAQS